MSERSLWYDGTRHVRPIRNFWIGTSLSNRIRIGTFDSNSNRISKIRRSLPKLETKSITLNAMQYRQEIVTRMPIMRVELITISTVTIRSIWLHSAVDFLHFGKFLPQICESCGTTYQRKYETFSALYIIQSFNRWRKERPNRSIIGDAILPQSATNVTKTCGSEFGALLWRHLTPQRKVAI